MYSDKKRTKSNVKQRVLTIIVGISGIACFLLSVVIMLLPSPQAIGNCNDICRESDLATLAPTWWIAAISAGTIFGVTVGFIEYIHQTDDALSGTSRLLTHSLAGLVTACLVVTVLQLFNWEWIVWMVFLVPLAYIGAFRMLSHILPQEPKQKRKGRPLIDT